MVQANSVPPPKPKTDLRRLAAISIITAAAAIGIRVLVFGLYIVPSSSMAPTLLIGDCIFASKYTYGYGGVGSFAGLVQIDHRIGGRLPRRGEVVVFKSPSDNRTTMVKRLIGLPGDKIRMYRSELYINGALVKRERLPNPLTFPGDDEPGEDIVDYIEYLPDAAPHVIRLIRELEDEETVNNTDEITVPPHFYFFLGDNRDRSDDSRVSDLGLVPEDNLTALAGTTFFSMSQDAHVWEVSKWNWAMRWHRLLAPII
jgi:signal peptidase I